MIIEKQRNDWMETALDLKEKLDDSEEFLQGVRKIILVIAGIITANTIILFQLIGGFRG